MNNIQLNRSDIERILPHRAPLLLADSAFLNGSVSRTYFFADPEMAVFKGHFPDDPVLPGVYITEALAQCADLLLLSLLGNQGLKPLLASIGGMRFFREVKPEDTLICEAELGESSPDMNLYECKVTAFIGDDTVKAAQRRLSLCHK